MKLNKDGSIRKKPGRPAKVATEHLHSFPTLTKRQTSIVLTMAENYLHHPLIVDGEPVKATEWVDLINAIARGIK